MKEQQPKLVKEIDVHKEGGLTLNHWRLILEQIGTPELDISEKIASYAQKVVSGEFPPKGFHHREYLGSRHWVLIKQIPTSPEEAGTKLGSQICSYARFEQYGTYTLNDYIHRLLSRERIWLNGNYSLGWTGSTWHEFYGYNYRSTDEYGERTTETINREEEAKKTTVLKKWLLDETDVQDSIHTPPKELSKILLAKARNTPLHEIQERLKREDPYDCDLWARRAYVDNLLVERKGSQKSTFMTSWETSDEREENEKLIERLQELYKHHYGIIPFVLSNLRTSSPSIVLPTLSKAEEIFLSINIHFGYRQDDLSYRVDLGNLGIHRPPSELPQIFFGQLEKEI